MCCCINGPVIYIPHSHFVSIHPHWPSTISHSYTFVFYRGLNKQGYKCRRKCTIMWTTYCYTSTYTQHHRYTSINTVVMNTTSMQSRLYSPTSDFDICLYEWCSLVINVVHISSLPECNAAIHKKCIDKIIGRCTGTAANSRDTVVRWDY